MRLRLLPARCVPMLLSLVVAVLCGASCDAEPTGGSPHDDVGEVPVDPERGLGIDYDGTSGGPVARWEPESADWTAVPWPTDRWRRADGSLHLTRFPNPQGVALVEQYLGYGERTLDGFGRNTAVYFQLSALLDPASLPSDDASRADPKALAQLVELTPGSPTYGQRFPLVSHQVTGGGDPYYLGPTLALRPVWGFPLADAGHYCAFLTRGLRDAEGRYLEPAPGFHEALATDPILEPLRDYIATSRLYPEDLAAATCFTTQDATRDMRRIQAFLEARPTSDLFDVQYSGAAAHYHEITARYLGPNFQSGTKPYQTEGGDVRFDDAGQPIVAEEEAIRVRILIPRNHTMPAEGWTVVLYSHGTTGDWRSCLDSTGNDVFIDGLAMICIDQPLHGDRGVDGADVIFSSFNFLNPESGRMTFRQAAADTLWLARLIADGRFDLPASASSFNRELRFDPERIVFFGHSHGGLAGIIVLGVDARIRGAVLSGASGVLAETIVRRKDMVDIAAIVALTVGVPVAALDTFHPIVNLAQTLVDVTDPVNYAPYWLEPVTGGRSKHVFMTVGTEDEASPAVGADAVAAAAGVPFVGTVASPNRAHQLKGLLTASIPVSQNVVSSTGQLVTAGVLQLPGGDHFVAFTDSDARSIWRGFLRAFRAGEAPVIAP